jgi:hypothetical protein
VELLTKRESFQRKSQLPGKNLHEPAEAVVDPVKTRSIVSLITQKAKKSPHLHLPLPHKTPMK